MTDPTGRTAPHRRRLQWLLSSEGTLSERAVRGGLWVFVLRAVESFSGLVRIIVLARVLAPNDFGLMGIALLVMSALEIFSETGFEAALIQKKEDIDDYLDTAWVVSALRGLILLVILYLVAPYAALLFHNPAATSIMRVVGLGMLLDGLTNIGVVYFQRELRFYKRFIYRLSGTVAELTVAIAAAFLLRSAWALVFGVLAGSSMRLVMSYLIHPYRPRARLDTQKAKELYGFGRWVLGSGILVFLLTQGDDGLVGAALGAAALGYYQMAYRLSNVPATEFTHVISQVTFPAYSKLQDDLPKLRDAYFKTLQITALITVPLAGGIFMLGPEFTRIVLGDKWVPMVPAMQVLCLFGVTRSIGATFGPLFQGMGVPQILAKASGIQLILMAIIIYPLTVGWGILGTSLAVTAPNLFVIVYLGRKIVRMVGLRSATLCEIVGFPILGTVVMGSLIWIFQRCVAAHNLVILFAATAIGITAYLGAILLVEVTSNYRLRETVNWGLKLIRSQDRA